MLYLFCDSNVEMKEYYCGESKQEQHTSLVVSRWPQLWNQAAYFVFLSPPEGWEKYVWMMLIYSE